MKIKQTGSVFINNGLWYYSVKLPGDKKRKQVPLKAPGANHTLKADRPRELAEQAAARYWEEHTHQVKRGEKVGITVSDLTALWANHCREYYKTADGRPTSSAVNALLDVRMFRDLFGNASVFELKHADMLQLRDALIRSGITRTTVNSRLGRVKAMLSWALDEALITATVKAELTQVKGVKRGRSMAKERTPVRPVDDVTIDKTIEVMMPNTADMVRVHRLTGMRPCEICAMKWRYIDTSRFPWVYRVPAEANKNSWRGEFGQPRVVCLGPRARAILEKHRDSDTPFSPIQAMKEFLEEKREKRVTPFYGSKKDNHDLHTPRELSEAWCTNAYTKTIYAACRRANIANWGANRLRHAFATEVRRQFGLDAAKAVLGHTEGTVTDIYTFDTLEDEMIRRAEKAVEALG